MCDQKFGHTFVISDFVYLEVNKKRRKLICETEIDTAHSTCCLDTVLVTLRSNTTVFSSPTTKILRSRPDELEE